jgi:hypothetical protein
VLSRLWCRHTSAHPDSDSFPNSSAHTNVLPTSSIPRAPVLKSPMKRKGSYTSGFGGFKNGFPEPLLGLAPCAPGGLRHASRNVQNSDSKIRRWEVNVQPAGTILGRSRTAATTNEWDSRQYAQSVACACGTRRFNILPTPRHQSVAKLCCRLRSKLDKGYDIGLVSDDAINDFGNAGAAAMPDISREESHRSCFVF